MAVGLPSLANAGCPLSSLFFPTLNFGCPVMALYQGRCSRQRRRSNALVSLGSQRPRTAPQLTMALVSPDSSNALFCLMASCAAVGQVMEAKTEWGAKLSAPLVALLFGMALAGTGIVPSAALSYDFVSSSMMPIAVALCLLETNMQSISSNAGTTLKAFLYGALGTIFGTVLSFKMVGHALGPDGWKIASSLCASYIGGTINYVATAQALGLTSHSTLAGGMAADNLAMAAYFAVIMAIPDTKDSSIAQTNDDALSHNSNPPTVESISTSLAAAAVACTLGRLSAGFLPSSFTGCGLAITALIASCFSMVAAKLHKSASTMESQVFAGSQILGGGLMLLYFAVVGASAGLKDAIMGGWPLLLFIVILMAVHLGTILLLGWMSKFPMRVVLIASNANIGGPGTAAAMANCRGWNSLVRPALLVGTLGYTIGTAIGCLVGLRVLQYIL